MIYRFEAYEINTDEYRLSCDGRSISIEPKVFDVIVYLISNSERVVTRNEFFSELWADVEVSDATLSNHIKLARSALGDNGQSQQVIKTVHGRGYQFVAALTEVGSEMVSENDHIRPAITSNASVKPAKSVLLEFKSISRILIVFACIVTITLGIFLAKQFQGTSTVETVETVNNVAPLSIAILPFEKLNQPDIESYFSDGIHGNLLTQISKISSIKTISHYSVMRYRNTDKPLVEIGELLSVAYILEGSVQRLSGHVRISVQLVHAKSNEQVWAETYTRSLNAENIFIIQNEISLAIVTKLNLILSSSERELLNQLPTKNLQALELYFNAKALFDQGTHASIIEGCKKMERAIQLDRTFAVAYSDLAIAKLDLIYRAGLSSVGQVEEASVYVNKALELAPQSSYSHTAFAVLKSNNGQLAEAEQAFLRAIELNRNNAKALHEYGIFLLWRRNEPHKAVDVLAEARRVSPHEDKVTLALVSALINIGRFDEAHQLVDVVIASTPNLALAYRAKSDAYYWQGHHLADSQRYLSKSLSLNPGMPFNTMVMSTAYLMVGEKGLARRWLQHAVDLAPKADNTEFAKGIIALLQNSRSEAFDAYMAGGMDQNVFPVVIYDVVTEGLQLNRSKELESYYRQNFSELFLERVNIDSTNYVPAIAVARILKTNGEHKHAEQLLRKCLSVVQTPPYGGWNSRQNDWKTQIYLALGNTDLALLSFKEFVTSGFGSKMIINSPVYQPLRAYPEYHKLIEEMTIYLTRERAKMNLMMSRRELMAPPPL